MRIAVLSGDDLSDVLALLRECGHEPVLAEGADQALAFAGGVNQPHVVVTHHREGRQELILRLRGAGAWVLGIAADELLPSLAAADDLLPLPAGAAALRARLLVAQSASTRVQMQARALFSDRLRSVGTLARGVAHEINNPLAVTLANLEFALAELEEASRAPDLAETAQALREAREGAERVRRIVRDLHVFARNDTDTHRALSVPRIVEMALGIAESEMKQRARVVWEAVEVPHVEANEQQLGQVVLNLLTNAAHAIPGGASGANEIRVRTFLEGVRVVIEVTDTGSGFRRRTCDASSTRSSRPGRRDRGPGSDSRCATRSSRGSAARSPSRARSGRAPRSACCCRGPGRFPRNPPCTSRPFRAVVRGC